MFDRVFPPTSSQSIVFEEISQLVQVGLLVYVPFCLLIYNMERFNGYLLGQGIKVSSNTHNVMQQNLLRNTSYFGLNPCVCCVVISIYGILCVLW